MMKIDYVTLVILILAVIVVSIPLLLTLIPLVFLLWLSGLISKVGNVNINSYFGSVLDNLQLEGVRSDIVQAVSNDAVKWDVDSVDQELREIKSEGERQHEHGELLFTFVIGILVIFAGTMNISVLSSTFHGWGIEALLLLLPFFVLVRVALLNRIAYSGVGEVKTGDLDVAVKWQKIVCNKVLVIPLLFGMALIRKIFGDNRYTNAMDMASEVESLDDYINLLKEEFSKRAQ
ncbi:hypothetical protein SAMN04487967_2949 [Natronorubrum sediminis]|uniref:Uncharacterized protein n=1 Tax=Natronorubrum sediminis TaxID=640943 RepID=A0A1H6G1U2_9EURY|nr:hypothetical protein [Natronorubrum sediminis]SEH17056.1 hypothetical protein SAMN04487967_2949 [Natronorubrum sediminis]